MNTKKDGSLKSRGKALRTALFTALCVTAGVVGAQQFPGKPVTVIFPYPTAGTPILALRLVTDDITARTGKAFVIDSRPGGQGTAGMTVLARAETDGYTIGFLSTGAVLVNPFIMQVDWKPQNFTPLLRTSTIPIILVSDPNFPPKSLAEVVKLARDKPDTVSVAISGASNRITLAQIEAATGARFLKVPTTQVARNLVMGGHTNMSFEAPSSVKGLVQEGKLNAVAMGSAKRFSYMPNVPTMTETVPGIEATTWFGFLAPKGVDADKLAWFNREIAASMKQQAVVAKYQELGYDVLIDTTPAFEEEMRKTGAAYEKIIKDLNITN